jgi:hypothetical protein
LSRIAFNVVESPSWASSLVRKPPCHVCLPTGAISSLFLVSAIAAAQQGDCSAQVTVTQLSSDADSYGATFKYQLDATSDADSAVVHFKLVRTYNVNGQPHSQAEPWSVKTTGGSGSEVGEVRESSSPKQIAWSVQDVFCRKTPSSSNSGASSGEDSSSDSDIQRDKNIVGSRTYNEVTNFDAGSTLRGLRTLVISKAGPNQYIRSIPRNL